MPNTHTTETHLSKDELLEILNEIDTEQHYHPKGTNNNRSENPTHHRQPNPSNQFY